MSVVVGVGVTCPDCGRARLERGDGLYTGMFVCRACGRAIGRMVLAVRLLNDGWPLDEAALATGLSVESIRLNLRYNYRHDGPAHWVDRGVRSFADSGGGLSG